MLQNAENNNAAQSVESANTETTTAREVPRLKIKHLGVNKFVEAPEDLEWACATNLEGLFQCDSGYFVVQFDPVNPSGIIDHSRIFMDTDEVVEWCIHAGAKIPADVLEDFTERYSESE